MKIVNSLVFTFVLTATAFFLFGCGHKNPLMAEEYIGFVKEKMFFDDDRNPIRDCSRYYAGNGNSAHKEKCEVWSQTWYKIWLNNGSLPSTATLDDFRDPPFWQAVEPK